MDGLVGGGESGNRVAGGVGRHWGDRGHNPEVIGSNPAPAI